MRDGVTGIWVQPVYSRPCTLSTKSLRKTTWHANFFITNCALVASVRKISRRGYSSVFYLLRSRGRRDPSPGAHSCSPVPELGASVADLGASSRQVTSGGLIARRI